MSKKYLFGFILCVALLSSSVCRAENSEFKNYFRKVMIDSCVEGALEDDDVDMPPSVAVKYCRCAVDKTLEKYSLAEIMALEEYDDNTDKFMEDMEKSAVECVAQMLGGKK